MTIHKRFNDHYQITAVNPDSNVTVDCHTLVVDGNLSVNGNVTYIETTDLYVDDPFLTIAANNSGANRAVALFTEQGFVSQTSANTFAGLRFNNATEEWEISVNVTADGAPISSYNAIGTATAGSVGGPQYSIQFHDAGNVFGGSANFVWNTGNNSVYHQGHYILGNIGSAPAATANSTAVYSAAVGSGGTGVYVKSNSVDDEVCSRSKAIVFGIIF
jgi:hypothetical protein